MKRIFILDFDNTIVLNPNYSSFVHLPILGSLLPKRYVLAPGVKKVLNKLRERGDRIIILTKTTVLPEKRKIRKVKEAGIGDLVDEIIVVRKKTPEVVKGIVEKFPGDRYYMVGNSIKNDVIPALGGGVRPVYIPRGVGEGAEALKRIDNWERVIVLRTFEDLVDLP